MATATLLVLCAHGATYLTRRTRGAVHARSRRLAAPLWTPGGIALAAVALETRWVRPELIEGVLHRPLGLLGFPVVAGGTALVVTGLRDAREERAFAGSCAILLGVLGILAVGLYPVLLRSTIAPEFSVTATQAASGRSGLALTLRWWPMALLLSLGSVSYVSRRFRGKVAASDGGDGYA